jgi:hypothetical protein
MGGVPRPAMKELNVPTEYGWMISKFQFLYGQNYNP